MRTPDKCEAALLDASQLAMPPVAAGPGSRLWPVLVLGAVLGTALTLLLATAGRHRDVGVSSQQVQQAQQAPLPLMQPPVKDKPPASVSAGPWGLLEFTPITLVAPDETLAHEPCPTYAPRWRLPRHTQAELEDLFNAAALTPAQQAEARAFSSCAPAGGCTLSPSQSFIGGLSQAARGEIYRRLAVHAENFFQYYSRRWHPEDIDPWFQGTDLSAAVQTQMRALLYQQSDGLWSFADVTYMCYSLGEEDRRGFLRAYHSETSLDARLRVLPGADVDQLVRYWGTDPTQQRTIRPMLEALARAQGGSLNVGLLLPQLARARLQTYPTGSDRGMLNCFWSALNFTATEPDQALQDPVLALADLRRRYDEVGPGLEARLGDVWTIQRGADELLHAAVYIADGVYFTKNGRSRLRPWILCRKQQLLDLYPMMQGLREVSYRQRG